MKKKSMVRLFYKGKHCKKTNTDNIFAMFLLSLLGIFICAICLMGSTWAWFTATQSTQTQNIQAASYTVAAEILADDGTPIATDNTVTLQKGTYTVTLAASGDATTGYTTIKIGNTDKLIFQFPSVNYSEKTITFTLVMNEPAKVEFASCWGTSVVDDTNRILKEQEGKHTYGKAEEIPPADEKDETTEPPADTTEDTATEETTPPISTEHTVVSGDTLSSIASKYNTTVAKLAAYNNIENVNKIKIGDVIKIPPDDYVIPEVSETTNPLQQTKEGTEPSKTEDNNVPSTE